MEATLHGLRISYRDEGPRSAVPVVFLHGFPFSGAMWDAEVALLKEKYRVIAYDHRGHGASGVGDGQYLVDLFVDDLIALLDHLKLDRVVLCGLSMGGYIALRAIERFPARVRALVLCDTRSEPDTNEAKTKRADGVRAVKEKGAAAFADNFVKVIFAPESGQRCPRAIEKIRKIIASNPPLGIAGTLIALAARTDTTPILSSIQVPVLILVGEKDAVTPPSAAQSLQKAIPGSRLTVLPHAGHMSNLENPEGFHAALLPFLAGIQ